MAVVKWSVVVAVGVAALVAATILGWIRVRQEREFRRLIAVGDAALVGGQTSVAIEAFSGAVALKPVSMLAYLKRGDTYRRRGEYHAAMRDLRQSRLLDPTATRPIELVGDTNVAMGEYTSAIDNYRSYLALDDRNPRVLYKMALALYRSGDAASAIEPVRRAIVIDTNLAEAHYLLAMCLRDRNRNVEAQRALKQAINLKPDLVAARSELADLYASMGRVREEIEQLESLTTVETADANSLVSVALAYARHGRTDTAITTLRRALDRFPGSVGIYSALGRVWLQIADANKDPSALRQALELLQPMATRTTATSDALTLYGRALLMSGNSVAAERIFQEATRRFPVDPDAFRYLADVASRLGHAELARASLLEHSALAVPWPQSEGRSPAERAN